MQKDRMAFSIQVLTFTAMLTALQIVLANLLQIPLLGKQYSLWLLPIAAAGALLGPVPAMIVGALGDLIGANLFPQGAYFPGFTLTNALAGLVCGLVLHRRRPHVLRVIIAVAVSLLIAWLLNSFWLSLLGFVPGRSFWAWAAVRAVNYPIELVVNVGLTFLTLVLLGRATHVLPSQMRLTRGKGEM
ncbi:MAG: folate family ECF transporter S component [Clostridia bacterium]|nr:folate family ECF transporter S component [Clostridia bacterium]